MTDSEPEINLEAYAKVNLTLEIFGRRSDGYHDLRSILMPVSLTDTVSLSSAPVGEITLIVSAEKWIDMKRLGPVEKNLAVRVVRLMQQRYKLGRGVKIRIHKRIPIGGGMGGGSADAAAVIHGLNRLWGLDLTVEELSCLAADLGSDIPALILSAAAVAEGRGERVKPLFEEPLLCPVKHMWLVIANPGIMCSTERIFRNWRADLTNSPEIINNIRPHIQNGNVNAVADLLYNGLEETVFALCPQVADAAHMLKAAGCLGVLLSGSGASVFGMASSKSHAEAVSRRLPDGLWHRIVRTCPVV
ncbi:MAG: 4-(cytidine 5'-diphospho)-2-C-methyl-D-erythritol kinase [Kiritimatiellia bacterium]